MAEKWKPIKGYEGLYEISNRGRVKTLVYDRLMICNPRKDGYCRIGLYKNGNQRRFGVHILVALHFKKNPENKKEVNHKDKVRHHNWASNVEWATHEENMKHCFSLMEKPINTKKIYCYDLMLKYKGHYDSINEAAKALNMSRVNISNVLHGRNKQNKGYIFTFARKSIKALLP